MSGAFLGAVLTGDVISPTGDSHYRYLSGLLLAIGLGFWSTIAGIEGKTARFRILTAIVVAGGCCRVVALATHPRPATVMLLAAVMEVAITPLLCLWQSRIASRFRPRT